MIYDVNSIDDMVRELGGNTAVAEWLDISQEAVSNWKSRGAIPPGWHLRLVASMRRRGRTVNPALFGITEDEAQEIGLCLRPVPNVAA